LTLLNSELIVADPLGLTALEPTAQEEEEEAGKALRGWWYCISHIALQRCSSFYLYLQIAARPLIVTGED
jgi:hypothetical protein